VLEQKEVDLGGGERAKKEPQESDLASGERGSARSRGGLARSKPREGRLYCSGLALKGGENGNLRPANTRPPRNRDFSRARGRNTARLEPRGPGGKTAVISKEKGAVMKGALTTRECRTAAPGATLASVDHGSLKLKDAGGGCQKKTRGFRKVLQGDPSTKKNCPRERSPLDVRREKEPSAPSSEVSAWQPEPRGSPRRRDKRCFPLEHRKERSW